MNYRARAYKEYRETHWEGCHTDDPGVYQFFSKILKRRFGEYLPKDRDSKIIDIGCGPGYFLYYLQQEKYSSSEGIDWNAGQIQTAKAMGIQNAREADLFDYLKLKEQYYDLIITNDLIEHLKKEEILSFLDLLYKSLKPDGSVIISTINTQSLLGSSLLFIDITHETGLTPQSLKQVLSLSGFENIRIYGEKPVVHDLRSGIRAALWKIIAGMIALYKKIESGTGRGFWKEISVFEPRMYAVARKGRNRNN